MQSGSPYQYQAGVSLGERRDYTSLIAVALAAFAASLALALFFQANRDKPACPCHPNHGHHGAVIGEKVQ